jgi:hypothetical protein
MNPFDSSLFSFSLSSFSPLPRHGEESGGKPKRKRKEKEERERFGREARRP